VKIQIICGFLGAGKTTLLKNILQQRGTDTAVLVNEFGELGIDGTLISEGSNLNVIEMPSGCICCSLKKNLVEAVRDILRNIKPKYLIIEPSGVASPSSVLLGLKEAEFGGEVEFAPVLGVIDLTFYPKVIDEDLMASFFKDQILNSDILLLNKADLVSNEILEKCRNAISALNPSAIIIPTIYCNTELPNVSAKEEIVHFHFTPIFTAEAIILSGIIDRSKINSLLQKLANKEFGNVFRAKGIVLTEQGPSTFDYVHGLINFGTLQEAKENKFVFIGRDIQRLKIENFLRGDK